MARLKYTAIDTQADWVEDCYDEVVKVVGGYVETTNPLSIEWLSYRGFAIVPEPTVTVEADDE